jgi:hypothetical protein
MCGIELSVYRTRWNEGMPQQNHDQQRRVSTACRNAVYCRVNYS